MTNQNTNLEQVLKLLAALKSEIGVAQEKYEKILDLFGENHPQTITSRQELDLLLAELKNFVYWLNQINL